VTRAALLIFSSSGQRSAGVATAQSYTVQKPGRSPEYIRQTRRRYTVIKPGQTPTYVRPNPGGGYSPAETGAVSDVRESKPRRRLSGNLRVMGTAAAETPPWSVSAGAGVKLEGSRAQPSRTGGMSSM
jgi:hypothetical protein